jgi:hypothetical protein
MKIDEEINYYKTRFIRRPIQKHIINPIKTAIVNPLKKKIKDAIVNTLIKAVGTKLAAEILTWAAAAATGLGWIVKLGIMAIKFILNLPIIKQIRQLIQFMIGLGLFMLIQSFMGVVGAIGGLFAPAIPAMGVIGKGLSMVFGKMTFGLTGGFPALSGSNIINFITQGSAKISGFSTWIGNALSGNLSAPAWWTNLSSAGKVVLTGIVPVGTTMTMWWGGMMGAFQHAPAALRSLDVQLNPIVTSKTESRS